MNEADIFRLYEGLDHLGLGSDRASRAACRHLPALRDDGVILDLGCGTGAQTLSIANELRRRVIALDIHQPFLDHLNGRAQAMGLNDLVEARCQSFEDVEALPRHVDVVWSEGAIYFLGFEAGLRAWRPLLRDGGHMVISDLCWWGEARPEPAAAFLGREYPDMASESMRVAQATAAGFDVIATERVTFEEAQAGYYQPVLERVAALEAAGEIDPELAAASREEAAAHLACGEAYGSTLFVLRTVGVG